MNDKNERLNTETKEEIIARIIANNDFQIKADAVKNILSSNGDLSEDELKSKIEQEQQRLIEKLIEKQLRKEYTPQELRKITKARDAYEANNKYAIEIPTPYIEQEIIEEEDKKKKSIIDWVKDKTAKAKQWWNNLESSDTQEPIISKTEEREKFSQELQQEVSSPINEIEEDNNIEQEERENN